MNKSNNSVLGLTHAIIGIAINKYFHIANNIYEYALAGAFAVLPDIDHPSSFFGKIFYPISIKIYSKLGHRTFTHSILFMTIVLTPMLFTPYFKLAFVSMISHLLGDAITYTGVPFLYPYKKNFVILNGILKTGSVFEIFISIICVLVIFLC